MKPLIIFKADSKIVLCNKCRKPIENLNFFKRRNMEIPTLCRDCDHIEMIEEMNKKGRGN